MTTQLSRNELTQKYEGKRCSRCKGYASVAYIDGGFRPRCNCYPQAPFIGKEDPAGERLGEMVNQSIAVAKNEEQVRDLTESTVQHYLCPDATREEAYLFIKLCQALEVNPFTREAYLIKYKGQRPRTEFIVGIKAYLRWANDYVEYAGYKSGVIIKAQGQPLEYREGAIVLDGEVLVGGWCEVYRHDWKVAPRRSVMLKEYDKHQSVWLDKPATMIEKVAIVQGHSRAFPAIENKRRKIREFSNEASIEVSEGVGDENIEDRYVDASAIEAPADVQESPEVESPVEAQKTPSEPIRNAGELMERAATLNMDRATVLKNLGIKSFMEVDDWDNAWRKLQEAK